MVLSRVVSSITEEKNFFFLKCLKSVIEKQDERIRNDPPISAWKEVADRCHERGIFLHHTARTLRATKWKQICRYVKLHFDKGQLLSEKDKLVIQIRRLQIPSFCMPSEPDKTPDDAADPDVTSEDEPSPEFHENFIHTSANETPESYKNPISSMYESPSESYEDIFPTSANIEPSSLPEIPESLPLLPVNQNTKVVNAYLKCCRLYRKKTKLEMKNLKLQNLKLQLEIQNLQQPP